MKNFLIFGASAADKELLFVLIVMGVLLIGGVVAVIIFIRQWRKEHPAKD